ncbi:MAG: hypothetical protein BGO21_19070 [Dyadobacter sp. 50-39]|uniref:hypothetical protein n=1 Tax=Dyadobacter sp. 50-39 TaxID=1895756 RepID=UPI00096510D7|nr:hypothetical protein [Dyadobacter sp. 50-39]OJV14794.1 MAG: hypothetical protein BGO21_19070 [Dyadobacter sp. 50-39]
MSKLLIPPTDGVTVRMYRQGHGDCFLLAFATDNPAKPYYVLIDCGLKPGSQDFIHPSPTAETGFRKGPKIEEIVKHIGDSTGNHLDLMIVTHEHQDHLNGIWKKTKPYFQNLAIDKAWFAWTEDPDDELANTLRQRHKDQLLGLLEARKQLVALAADDDGLRRLNRLDSLLELETGSEKAAFGTEDFFAADKDITRSVNKQGLKLIKDKAAAHGGIEYLMPGDEREIAASRTKVYVFGPPRDEDLLTDEDPRGTEAFPDDDSPANGFSMLAAANTAPGDRKSPFDARFHLSFSDSKPGQFVADYYGHDESDEQADKAEVAADAPWRRIDHEWLYSAESLALQLNTGINNTSLVLAFELPRSGKVLLFAGDAQRGNWISWPQNTWRSGDEEVTVRELLGRTVLYKVAHHCSHNATLAGQTADEYPNLSWMATGKYASEFTAMITAVNKWALTKNNPPWRHPLPSIRRALEEKTSGRIFQTDQAAFTRKATLPAPAWDAFLSRATVEEMYFDYVIHDTAL